MAIEDYITFAIAVSITKNDYLCKIGQLQSFTHEDYSLTFV